MMLGLQLLQLYCALLLYRGKGGEWREGGSDQRKLQALVYHVNYENGASICKKRSECNHLVHLFVVGIFMEFFFFFFKGE